MAMGRLVLTLDNLQAGLITRVDALLLADLCAQALADAFGNRRAVNLGGGHCCSCSGEVSPRTRSHRRCI